MGTGHSDAWSDLGPDRHSGITRLQTSLTQRKVNINKDSAIVDMLEVITSMKINTIISNEEQKTRAQIFFDEIDGIVDYIERTEGLTSDRKATIRHIGLRLQIDRQLIDGFFLYTGLIKSGNSIFVENLKTKLNKVPRGLNGDGLKIYWQNNKSNFTGSMSSFDSFKKIVTYYQHQN